MQVYEIATLTTAPGKSGAIAAALGSHFAENKHGELVGCWTAESGLLNRVCLMTAHASQDDMIARRSEVMQAAAPFGCADGLVSIDFSSWRAMPGLPPMGPGALGNIYEFRTYFLKPGGLEPTLAGWEADAPVRREISPLAIALYAIEGAPRIIHLWPYRDYTERLALRREAIDRKVWPARGTPPWLTSLQVSEIFLPASFSPFQ